jgi:uncharacterized protein involved in type VI secretion and phage assembly
MESIALALGTTVSTLSTVTTVIGTAVSAMGSMAQGQQQAAMYEAQAKAQAQAQEYNATVARNNAQIASDQANAKEEAQRRNFARLQGQAVAGIAQSGTGFEGSNYDLLKQNETNNELDALTIRYQGQNQSSGLLAQAQLDEYNANVTRQMGPMNAERARSGGYWNAGAALFSGLSKTKYS